MSLFAITIIAALLTLLLIRSGAIVPALVVGVITVVLAFATFPALGPATTGGLAEFVHRLGADTGRTDPPPTTTRTAVRPAAWEDR